MGVRVIRSSPSAPRAARMAAVAASIAAASRPADSSTTTTKRGGTGDWPSAWNTNPATNSATRASASMGRRRVIRLTVIRMTRLCKAER